MDCFKFPGSLAVDKTYIVPMHLGMRFKVALGMKVKICLQNTNLCHKHMFRLTLNSCMDITLLKLVYTAAKLQSNPLKSHYF